jgi:sodium/bile acid cotransporter 7
MVLPLLLFHQLQLVVCAVIARRWARAAEESLLPEPAGAPALRS